MNPVKIKTTEHDHAKSLMHWCLLFSTRYPGLDLIFAVPNGGARHKAVAGKMKAEGVKAGVPDYFLPVARKNHHGLFIELKTEKGKPTPSQEVWIVKLRLQGYMAEVAYGWEMAAEILKEYLS